MANLPTGNSVAPVILTDHDYTYNVDQAGTLTAHCIGGGCDGSDGNAGNGSYSGWYCAATFAVATGDAVIYRAGSVGDGIVTGGGFSRVRLTHGGSTTTKVQARGSSSAGQANIGDVKHAGGTGGTASDSGEYPGGGGAPWGDTGTSVDAAQCDGENGSDSPPGPGFGGQSLFSSLIQSLLTAAGFGQAGGDGGSGGGAGGDATAPGGGGGGGSPPSGPGGMGQRGVVIFQFTPSVTFLPAWAGRVNQLAG